MPLCCPGYKVILHLFSLIHGRIACIASWAGLYQQIFNSNVTYPLTKVLQFVHVISNRATVHPDRHLSYQAVLVYWETLWSLQAVTLAQTNTFSANQTENLKTLVSLLTHLSAVVD